jgi:hypothetical protein
MNLTRKILAALLGMTTASIAVAVGALYPMVKLHTEQLVAARFEESLVPTARAVDNLFLDALRGMYVHVDDRAIREDVLATMTARLRNFTYVYPYLRRIYFTDRQGVVLSSSDPGDIGRTVFDISPGVRDNFTSVLTRPVGSVELVTLTKDRDADDQTFQLLATMQDSQQHVGGVLVAELLDAPFEEILRDISERAIGTQQAYLMEVGGNSVLSSDRVNGDERLRSVLAAHPELLRRMNRDDAGWALVERTDEPMLVAACRLTARIALVAGASSRLPPMLK